MPRTLSPGPSAAAVFPRSPQGWGIVCASSALRRGGVRPARLMGRPVVAFRGLDGRAGVLAPHCPHMGTALGGGRVTREGLACPLHGWTFDADGTCRRAAGGAAVCFEHATFAYPVEERAGAVFAFNGPVATHVLPDLPGVRSGRPGRTVVVEAPWEAVSANGFDMQHLATVHGRAVREAPAYGAEGEAAFALSYASRVTGTGLADRAMKVLSDDHIRVALRSYAGTVVLVESSLRRTVSRLVVSLAPTPDSLGTEVTPLFTARGRGPAARLTRLVAAWLFRAFLAPDAEALRGIAFHPPAPSPDDDAFLSYLDFLRRQPQFTGPPR